MFIKIITEGKETFYECEEPTFESKENDKKEKQDYLQFSKKTSEPGVIFETSIFLEKGVRVYIMGSDGQTIEARHY